MVRTLSSNVGGMGSIPGLGTKIPHTVGCYQKVKKKKKKKLMHTHSFPHEHSFWRILCVEALSCLVRLNLSGELLLL